jgi:hypothetical protein
LAGFVMQTNSIGTLPLAVSLIAGLVSYIEIKLSRPYKELKRSALDQSHAKKLEKGLKITSLGTIVFTIILILYRIAFGSFF